MSSLAIVDELANHIHSLPMNIFYHILSFTPCYGITQKTIRNQMHFLSAYRLLCTSVIMGKEERSMIRKNMKTFDFLANNCYFQYEDDFMYIGIWSDVCEKEFPTEADYIVLYYS